MIIIQHENLYRNNYWHFIVGYWFIRWDNSHIPRMDFWYSRINSIIKTFSMLCLFLSCGGEVINDELGTPLLKFKFVKITKSAFVIITTTPESEKITPNI